MQRLGQIGVGTIGKFYALNIIKSSKTIRIFDLGSKNTQFLKSRGAIVCESPRQVVEKSDLVLLALPNPEAVEDVVLGHSGLLSGIRKDTIVLDLSTIDPQTSIRMAEELMKKKAYYLDAPVSGGAPLSGGTEGARKKNVTFMVGGNKKAYIKALPVMRILGKKFFYLGKSGSGSAVKLLSNMVNGVIAVSIAEAFALGLASGIETKTLRAVFDETDADNYYLQNYLAPRLAKGNYRPGFTMELQRKDHRLASDLGRKHGVPLIMNEMALQAYQMAINSGFSGFDYSAIHLFWRKLSQQNGR